MNQNESKKSAVAESEESILSFWQENKIFEKTLEKEAPSGTFTFYDGPPFATGLPHYGHLLAGTIKDIIPRYKTMQGYHVPRKWGWDCHGLPVENLIEKELGLETKKDIEDYGVEKFNMAAKDSVLRYEKEWKRYVPRSGRFVDMDNAYIAMDPEYMESIWWVFSELTKKGLTKEGFKAMHLCPRCETTLSNFEVNQGYKDVTDITVTAKFELKSEPGTFLLAWTTTPWTLPGNVALAVGADIDYVKIKLLNSNIQAVNDGELPSKSAESYCVILSREIYNNSITTEGDFLFQNTTYEKGSHEIISELKGSDLEGLEYTAPFDYYQNDPEIENRVNGWKILTADFVTTEDGTGIVHIAPAFGSDDMQLGQEHDLPFIQHVSKSGAFRHVFAETVDEGDFRNMLVKQKNDLMSTDIEIIKRLAHDGTLFSKKKVVHSYPHCWRCDTPLLNYATSSWYVDVPAIKDKLIASNEKVNWVPEHVGEGRFGKWLEGARDWALSRSRFWGTPLPVWYNPITEQNVVMGSYDELCSYAKTSGNTYYAVRHGESQSNVAGSINAVVGTENGLTEKGREQVMAEAQELRSANIDLVFVSPLQRTQETAAIIAAELGLLPEQVITDPRITERNPGAQWEGKQWSDFHHEEEALEKDLWNRSVEPDSETMSDVYKRSMDLLFEIESKYQNKNILFVSHGGTVRLLQFGVEKRGVSKHAYDFFYNAPFVKNADVLALDFKPFPHNDNYEIDIHRPYIDDFQLEQDGVKLDRVQDVFDVWFDSASMPYAQQHYPFENKDQFEQQFPAQFIAEGLDQTRGWFYVMTVIGNALFDKTPFENVIVNGLILAEDGKKMSKSLKNYPDPYMMFDTVGADAIRLYMINSPVVRAEEFAFVEKGVREVASKVMGRLRNTMSLYQMYAGEVDHVSDAGSEHVLDQWIIARLEILLGDVTKSLDTYELDKAARPIFDFVDDFSTWYVRRSRDRYKGDDIADKKKALSTTRYVFEKISKIIAPFVPFVAEELWQKLRVNDTTLLQSVHLELWPELDMSGFDGVHNVNIEALDNMALVRNIISEGLQLRSEAKIKVRQPLQSFTYALSPTLQERYNDYCELIKDELNVKEVINNMPVGYNFDLTPELIAEGNMRELLRGIQSMRKKSGLDAHDIVNLVIQTSPEGQMLFENFADEIKKTAGINEFRFTHNDGDDLKVGDLMFIIAIEK